MSTSPNPLMGGWPNPGGVNPSNPLPTLTPPAGPAGNASSTNPYGFGSVGGGALRSNLAESNLQAGLQRNALIPLFSKMMFASGGDAGQFFKMLTDLGSPFYQRKQQATFEQGAKAEQDAAGKSRQQITAAGAGYSPSGAGAAMFGGEAQAAAGNQEEAFLNNLFQNEQLQALGAQGLAQLASLFSPAQLTGQQTNPAIQQPSSTFGSEFKDVFGSIFSPFGKKG